MTSLERRLLSRSVLLGTLLTVAVILADRVGFLSHLENWFYDHRAQLFQHFTPAPTDQLIHLDIDDRALDAIGHWPWPRNKLAIVMDELRLAGPKAIEMDVIFPDPQQPRLEKLPDGTIKTIDDDALFAASLKRLNNVILGTSFMFGSPQLSPIEQAIRRELEKDIEEESPQVVARIANEFPAEAKSSLVNEQFITVRRFVIRNRIAELLDKGQLTKDQAITAIIKNGDVNLATPLRRAIEEQYDAVVANRALRRFAIMPAVKPQASILSARVNLPPIPVLSNAAEGGAFVDYLYAADGVVRSVPLLIEADGHYYGQLGFVLAIKMLDVDPSKIRVEADKVILPTPSGERTIPTWTQNRPDYHQRVATVMDVPWFGTTMWETMYDWPNHNASKQHISINEVWDIQLTREKIRTNIATIDDALKSFYEILAPDKLEAYLKSPLPPDDFESRAKLVEKELGDPSAKEFLDAYTKMQQNGEALDDMGKHLIAGVNAMKKASTQGAMLKTQLVSQQAKLAANLKGKAVLIGWIATGAADLVPTSMHSKCPGVVVHGAVFNGIMTGAMWTRMSWIITALVTAVLGISMAFGAGRFSPIRGLGLAIALLWGYILINGVIIFDYGNRIMGLAGPTIAVATVWAVCTLQRIILEQRERSRIENRFKNYVDPKLVDYMIENDLSKGFAGEVREMTVVFTDLVGFTTLSERLQEQTVPLLSEFLEMMVPVIRDTHQAHLNKFLGDGIMFFYGAPRVNRAHATAAVKTVLDMQEKLIEFNRTLLERGLPTLGMRAGISTGKMVVGDIGGAGSNDYTVLGDTVNLGARLESANKATGTKIMISENTQLDLDSTFLTRPLGRLQVAGKIEGVRTYEVICRMDRATEEQKKLVELTTGVVDSFQKLELQDCVANLDQIDKLFGASNLTRLYRELCRQYAISPPATPFDGKIVLTEK